MAIHVRERRKKRNPSQSQTELCGPKRISTDDFVTQVVSVAESTELYSEGTRASHYIEPLAGIVNKATDYKLTRLDQTESVHGLSERLEPSHSSEPSNAEDCGQQLEQAASNKRCDTASSSKQLLAIRALHNINDDRRKIPLPTRNGRLDAEQRFQGAARATVLAYGATNWTVSCQLRFSGEWITVSLKNQKTDARGEDLTSTESGLTDQSRTLALSGMSHPAFYHRFRSVDRPIPHLLHPSAEESDDEVKEPPVITFSEPQKICKEECSEETIQTTSLKYTFSKKSDRLQMCEMLFGKTIAMIAGANRIQCDGRELAHMTALVLWLDQQSNSLSMTLSANMLPGKGPIKDVEFQIRGLPKNGRGQRHLTKLLLLIRPISRCTEPSIQSPTTGWKTGTGKTLAKSTSSSGQVSLKCAIHFSNEQDRARFEQHCKARGTADVT